MSTVAILGTIGAVVELFDKADAVIGRFNKSYNPKIAPHELCRLYFLLLFLRERDAHVCAPEHKLIHLKELLQECETLIEEYDPEQADTYGSGPYTWPKRAEARLRPLINDIDDELLRLKFCIPGQGDQEGPGSWQAINQEPPSSLASTGASKAARQERRESIKAIELPVTITLRRDPNDERGQRFQLKWVNIVERDAKSRTLQYCNEEETIIVSHKITRGRLPFVEEKLDATQVNFNEPQKLVVQTDHHEAYKNIYPQYDFSKPKDLDTFIHKVRERLLIGKFLPDRIYPNKDKRKPLARCKVVRLWTRHLAPPSQTLGIEPQLELTMTFENTIHDQQMELNLNRFSYPAQLLEKDGIVELLTGERPGQTGPSHKITFLFQKKDRECAKRLWEDINNYHPCHPRPPRIIEPRFEPWSVVERWDQSAETVSHSEMSRKSFSISNVPAMSIGPGSITSMEPATPVFESRRDSGSKDETTIVQEPMTPSPRTRPPKLDDTLASIPLEKLPPIDKRDFEIAVICALTIESDAVLAAFDQRWRQDYQPAEGDSNTYSYGSIGQHNIVLVHMAGTGKIHAASAASDCRHSFPAIKLCLVVGVCGGVPETPDNDTIWLGDVAISESIVEYDYGRQYQGRFVLRDSRSENLPRTSNQITSLLRKLRGREDRMMLQEVAVGHLDAMQGKRYFRDAAAYPESAEDVLFSSSYQHKHRAEAGCQGCEPGPESTDRICDKALKASCATLDCDGTQVVRQRPRREDHHRPPAVHFGRYASGDVVMKSGRDRDNLAQDEGIIAFEMEGAAAWDSFPRCLVIKGICDYADSHKNKVFQRYAAATAAAYTKAFLEQWRRMPY